MHAVALYEIDPAKEPVVIQVLNLEEAKSYASDAWATGRYALAEVYAPGPDDADHDGIPDSVMVLRYGDPRAA